MRSVLLTSAAFLLRSGGVRRMAIELRRELVAAGWEVETAADVDRSSSDAAGTATQLSSLGRTVLIPRRHTAVAHAIYYDPPIWNPPRRVVTVHDMIHERFGIGSRRLALAKRLAVRRADIVACDSERTRLDLIERGLDPACTTTIPLGVSLEIVDGSEAAAPLADQPYVMYVGDRSGYKNFHLLVDALAGCTDLDPYGLVVVGGPNMGSDELAEIRERRRGATVVHLPGVDDRRLGDLYRGASALVVTSLYEGFGLSVVEALACGCPVASSGAGSLAEFDGGLAIRFDPRSAHACAMAIVAATQASATHRAAGTRHGATFTWSRTAADYAALYEQLGAAP